MLELFNPREWYVGHLFALVLDPARKGHETRDEMADMVKQTLTHRPLEESRETSPPPSLDQN